MIPLVLPDEDDHFGVFSHFTRISEANYASPLLKNMIFFSAAKHVSTKNFLVSPLYNQRPWPGALVTSSLNI
jgi:hypothetical protein